MKGSSPIPKVGAVLLIIAVVAVVSTIAVGPVQGALDQLGGQLEDKFDNRSPIVQVDNKEELAGVAKVTMDRAAECEAFEAHKPYNDLSDTSLGKNPKCRILPLDTLERFGENVGSTITGEGGGDDIEGRYGRTRINFTSDMILNSKKTYGSPKSGGDINDWMSQDAKFSIVGVVNGGFYSAVDGDHANPGKPDHLTSRATTGNVQLAEYSYIISFEGGNSRNRFDTSRDHEELRAVAERLEAPGIFANVGEATTPAEVILTSREFGASAAAYLGSDGRADGRTAVKICEGDRGYVQVNKLNPTDQALEEDTGDAGSGRTPLFGYIQITERADDCDLLRPETTIAVSHDNSAGVNSGEYPKRMDVDSVSDRDILEEEISGKHGSPNPRGQFPEAQPDSQSCMVSVMEKDGSTPSSIWDPGYIIFPQGVIINSEEGFPTMDQASLSDLPPEGNTPDIPFLTSGDTGPDSARAAYRSLANRDFDGNPVEGRGFNGGPVDESVSFLEDGTFSLVGDVICGQPPDQNRAKWLTCDPDGRLDGETIDAGGTQYECSGGEWSS